MTGNHWTVFNGAGAVVADNMPLDVARAYLTPESVERGWTAVYCIIVRDPVDFPAGGQAFGLAQQHARAVEASDEGHDPLCMAILRGKECTCGFDERNAGVALPVGGQKS